MTQYRVSHPGYWVVATDPQDALRQFLSNLNRIGTYTEGWTVLDNSSGQETYHATQEVAVFPEIGEMGVEYRELKEQISLLRKRVVELEAENAALQSGDSAPEAQLDPNRSVMVMCNCGCGIESEWIARVAEEAGWPYRELTESERKDLERLEEDDEEGDDD